MSKKPIKVLLVEDNPGDARLISEMLVEVRDTLFELKWVDRLSSGLQCLAAEDFDVVLLDLNLPDSLGMETFTKVHAQEPHMPIVILSGLANEEMALSAVREGAQDYLVKGNVDSNLLERSAHYAIERKLVEETLRKYREKIEGLHDAARRLEVCKTEAEAYQQTVKAAEKILAFKMCTLDIVEGNKLMVKATSSGLPHGASIETSLDETSLAERTYHTGKTIIFSSLDEVPDARPTCEEFKSGMSAPIGDLGVFQVVSTELGVFSQEDKNLLELLLGYAAEAIRRIRLQTELHEQAIRDQLTGTYNRRYFRETIEREIERSRRYGHCIAFLLIDVDKFKEINDHYGHQMGDEVLREVADFLRGQVRAMDMVVRYGGDEFLIIMPEMKDDPDIVKGRLNVALEHWNESSKLFDFSVRLSVGSACWKPDGAASVEEVLAKADQRMYQEKRKRSSQPVAGGTQWCYN